VRVAFDEARLLRVGRRLETGARVGDAQQRDAQTNVARGADDLFSEQVGVGIKRPVGRVVQIVKLADGGDAAEEHFEKGHACGVV
jgi:hypothetical protein